MEVNVRVRMLLCLETTAVSYFCILLLLKIENSNLKQFLHVSLKNIYLYKANFMGNKTNELIKKCRSLKYWYNKDNASTGGLEYKN